MTGNLWILFVFIYSFLKGTRDGIKKAALKKSSSTEILFFYTLIGFLLTLPFSKGAFSVSPLLILASFFKALFVCIAWFCALKALKKMPVSLYGIIDLSRIIFSTLLGVLVLGETLTPPKIIGIIVVIFGLLLVNARNQKSSGSISALLLIYALLNCFFNALSGTMDKILMKYMASSQLQFWFMFFMTLIYGIIILIRKEKISIKSVKTNYWIPILSLSLIIGDKLLFEANANPLSEVTYMTIIKQSSVFVTVLSGYLFFKEKDIIYKLICSLIVLAGILIALL